jgi:hypothetical protein
MSKIKHGGKRDRAGRPPLDIPKVQLSVKITPETFHQLRLMCKSDGISQAKKITQLINNTKK